MSLVGPELSQVGWTCVSGQACVLDAIAGHGLSALDALIVLETCGTAFSGTAGLPRPAAPLELLSSLHGRASWHDPLTIPGGDFRQDPSSALRTLQFTLDSLMHDCSSSSVPRSVLVCWHRAAVIKPFEWLLHCWQ